MNRQTLASAALALAALLALPGCGGESEADLVTSGREFLEKNDTKAAQIQLKNALGKNPNSAEARLLLGRALLQGGDPVAAVVELRKAQELKAPDDELLPDLARAMMLTGEESRIVAQFADVRLRTPDASADLMTTVAAAHLLDKDVEKARNALRIALLAKPMYGPAVTLQARVRASDGDLDGALFLLDELLAREPGNDRAAVLKAEVQRRGKDDPEAAMATLRKAVEHRADSFVARSAMVAALLQQGQADEARQQFAELRKVAPSHPDTLLYEAQFAFRDEDYRRVREIADRVLKLMPENLRALELAGAAEFRQRNWLQAEAYLGRALKVAPERLLSRQMLAQAYLRSALPDKAVEILRPVTEGSEADGNSLAMMGEAYLQIGDARRADAMFRQASRAAPDNTRVRTSVALAQLTRGDPSPAAMKELEAIAAVDSGTRADLALVSAHMRNRNTAAALKAIDALEEKTPDRPLAQHLRGRVLLAQNDIPGATRAFEAALAKDAQHFPSVASLAAIDLSAGRADSARQRFEALLQADPRNHQAALSLAGLAGRTGATPEEVTRLNRRAVEVGAGVPATHLALVNQLLATGQLQPALVAAQAAVAALPNDLVLLDALGRAQLASGDGQQALSTFRRLAGLQPSNPVHHVRMADVHMTTQDHAAATRSLRQALELQPDLLPAQRGLAAIALLDKRPQQALAIAREIQTKHPNDAAGWALEGDIEASQRRWEPAATAYRGALKRREGVEAAIKLHSVLASSGKTAEAARWADQWQREHTTDAAFPYYLGDVALAHGRQAEAEAHYRRVLAITPHNALAMNNVAWLLVQQRKPGALPLAERANELLPGRAPLLDTLAAAQAAENQVKKAIETQKRAITRAPQDPSLKLHLAKLLLQDNQRPQARAELEDLARLGDRYDGQTEVAALLKSL